MKNYRFTSKEIEQMKSFILTSINREDEKRTAWRARLCYEMQARCTGTKKSRAKGERMVALYESLTTDDLPNWTTPDPNDYCMTFAVSDNIPQKRGGGFNCLVYASQNEIDELINRGGFRRFNAELYSEKYERSEQSKYTSMGCLKFMTEHPTA